eukprot:gene31029-53266_t
MIPFLDLSAMHAELRPQLDDAFRRVLDSSNFILGPETAAFEREFVEAQKAAYMETCIEDDEIGE